MIQPAGSRIAYLDNLRILVTILVVLHHIAITYGAPGDWYVYDAPVSDLGVILLTIFVALNSSFFMGFFFLLAGYFAPKSYDRKGPVRFLRDRFLRLGIPLAVFTFPLDPLINAIQAVGVRSPGYSFGQAYWLHLQDLAFNPGPLWFVTALLIFTSAYAAVRWPASLLLKAIERQSHPRPETRAVLAFAFAVGIVTFLVRVPYPSGRVWFVFQLGDFPQYAAFFIAGILVYRNGWLDQLTPRDGRIWRWTALGGALALPIIGSIGGALDGDPSEFLGGFRWESLLGSLWWSVEGVAISMALLATFMERPNRQGWLCREAARYAYTVYIIHAPVVVGISILMMRTGLPSGVKLLLTAVCAVGACSALSAGVRRLPLVRRIL